MGESVFTLEATPIKFGPGAVDDAGWELRRLGVKRALLVTDPGIVAAERVLRTLRDEGIEVVVFDGARVEPTIESLQGPLKPHLAIPTTCGSEATTVAVLDIPERRVKTGISHRYLRPAQAIVDPDLTRTLPAEVVGATGLDVICHAAESFLAKPYTARAKPSSPDERPPYQGANPVADVWSAKALEYGGRFLERHRRAAELLGGTDLPETLQSLMDDLNVPTLSRLGYSQADIPDLVEGAMAQERLLAVAPRDVGPADLAQILQSAL